MQRSESDNAARRLRRVLERAATALAVAIAASFGARANAQEPPSPNEEEGAPFDVPLYVDGRNRGEVPTFATQHGLRLDPDRLRDALSEVVTSDVLNRLERLRLERAPLTPERLSAAGIATDYDPGEIAIRIMLLPGQRRIQRLSVSGRFDEADAETATPAPLAAGVGILAEQRWDRDGESGAAIDLDGFVTFGASGNTAFVVRGGFDEMRARRWSRREVAFIHDDERRAVRTTIGDVFPRATGFQSASPIVGVALARAFGEIQPDRNVRAAGRGLVSVDRNSDVEIIVNGVVADRLRLAPGRYDLADLPFTDGLSDVRIAVDDPLGRRETIIYSGFAGAELLDVGITDFQLAAGMLRSFDDENASPGAAATGFLRRGLRKGLTVGGDFQSGPGGSVIGGSLSAATRIGIATIEAALSRAGARDGRALAVGLRSAIEHPKSRDLLQLRAEAIDVDFRTMDDSFRPPLRARALVSAQRSWRGGAAASLGLAYEKTRSGQPILRASVGLSRTFARFGATVRAEYIDASGRRPETRLSAALAYRFGDRQIGRIGRDGATGALSTEWRRLERSGVGDWSAGVQTRELDGRRSIGGDAAYLANRFRVAAAHRVDVDETVRTWRGAEIEYAGARVRSASRIALGTAVGYAGGRIAFGREIGSGFVLLQPDASLGDRRVPIEQGGRKVAIVDRRPVLAPVMQPYRRLDLTLDGSALPDGYDLGDPRLTIRPALRNAYVHVVGSPALTIAARLRDRDGAPASLLIGLLRPIGSQGGAPIPFFTNRTGRMIAERVPPGRYAIHVEGRDEAVGELVAPKSADGMADLGDVSLNVKVEFLR